MANRNEYMRMYYKRRKELGLCKICGEPTKDGRILCPFCVIHTNALRKMNRAASKSA